MSKADFIKDGYISTNTFDETFIRDLQEIIETSEKEKLGIEQCTSIEIINWMQEGLLDLKQF